jgi:hypothetical protein
MKKYEKISKRKDIKRVQSMVRKQNQNVLNIEPEISPKLPINL